MAIDDGAATRIRALTINRQTFRRLSPGDQVTVRVSRLMRYVYAVTVHDLTR